MVKINVPTGLVGSSRSGMGAVTAARGAEETYHNAKHARGGVKAPKASVQAAETSFMDGVDHAVGTVDAVANKAMMVNWIAPGALAVAGSVVAAPAKLFGKPGKAVAKLINKGASAPRQFLNSTTLSDIGGLTDRMGLGRVSDAVVSFTEGTAGNVAKVAEKYDGSTVGKFFSDRSMASASRSMDKASTAAANLSTTITENIKSPLLAGRVEKITAALATTSETASQAAGGIATATQKLVHTGNVQAVAQATSKLAKAEATAMKMIKSAGADPARAGRKAAGEAILAELKNVRKPIEKVLKQTTNALHSIENAKPVAGIVKGLPGKMKGASLSTTVTNGAFLTADAVAIYSMARGLSKDFDALGQMYADTKGLEKKPSLLTVMTADMPPVLAAVRSDLMKQYAAKGTMRLLTTALDVVQVVKGRANMKLMFGAQLASGGVSKLVGTNEVLPAYSLLSQAHKSGQLISAEDYAAFITAACPECQNHKGGTKNAMIVAVSEQLAKENISPAAILAESGKGLIKKRIDAISTAYESSHPKEQTSPAISHTQRIAGAKPTLGPVLGTHTENVANRAHSAALAHEGR